VMLFFDAGNGESWAVASGFFKGTTPDS